MGRLYPSTTSTPTPQSSVSPTTGKPINGRLYRNLDLSTSAGLQQLAEKTGLGEEAKRLTAEKGEKPKEFWSGGFIMDTFDTLNALQYGVTGVLKGKSFAEGVKTRQSFSDKDALGEYGLPGIIGGIALDIAVDPLTYINPTTALRKIAPKKALDVASTVGEAVKTSRMGQSLGRAFVYRFGQDKVYKDLAEKTIKNSGRSIENVLELARPLTKLDSADQRLIAEFRKAGKLDDLPTTLLEKARPAFSELDRLGKESVRLGLLKKEIYDENMGSYLARLYMKHEAPLDPKAMKKLFISAERKPARIDISRFMKRDDIPQEVREAMGEILEAGYPTAKSLIQLSVANEKARFFNEVAKRWGKEEALEGFSQLPKTNRLGELAGKYVPEGIYDDIQEMIRVKTPWQKTQSKVVGGFKFGKVVLNPATHSRNMMSNMLLNHFEDLPAWRADIYGKAFHQVKTKGKLYKEAKDAGMAVDTFASQELEEILKRSPEAKTALQHVGNKVKDITDGLSNLYQKEEEWAKMAMYIYQRGKGVSPDDAVKIAERATFNYAQVTPFIRRLRESLWGYPFITFSYKATPQIARTVATKPTKISNIGKIKQGIENLVNQKELEEERASEPSWVRDGFYLRLPGKDKHGRSPYLDLTYLLPFGDLATGQIIRRDVSRETGIQEEPITSLVRKLPVLDVFAELTKNQDFFGNQIYKDSAPPEQIAKDIFRHIVKFYSPPFVGDILPGGYRSGGERVPSKAERVFQGEAPSIEGGGKQTRTSMQELLSLVGLKVQPVDLEFQNRMAESEKRKALTTLLNEEGVTAQFKKTFIPKQ